MVKSDLWSLSIDHARVLVLNESFNALLPIRQKVFAMFCCNYAFTTEWVNSTLQSTFDYLSIAVSKGAEPGSYYSWLLLIEFNSEIAPIYT